MTSKLPAGVLVLYDERKGLRQPQVKIFNPSTTVEQDVNDWIAQEEGITVYRVDWVPSGGLLGAAVSYGRDAGASEAIRIHVPGLRKAMRRGRVAGPLLSIGFTLVFVGILLGMAGLVMFTLFYPETWNGDPGGYGISEEDAVRSTVLTLGTGIFLVFTGIFTLVRARLG